MIPDLPRAPQVPRVPADRTVRLGSGLLRVAYADLRMLLPDDLVEVVHPDGQVVTAPVRWSSVLDRVVEVEPVPPGPPLRPGHWVRLPERFGPLAKWAGYIRTVDREGWAEVDLGSYGNPYCPLADLRAIGGNG